MSSRRPCQIQVLAEPSESQLTKSSGTSAECWCVEKLSHSLRTDLLLTTWLRRAATSFHMEAVGQAVDLPQAHICSGSGRGPSWW